MKRLIPFLPLVALVLLGGLFAFFALPKNTTRIEPDFTVGKPASELMLPFLEGGPPVSLLAQIKGPALVNVFASWCAPCLQEAPFLGELHKQGVRIIGIDQGKGGVVDNPSDVADFLARGGDPFNVILADQKGQATIDFGATGLPETFVVDSRGMIVGKHTGPLGSEADVAALMTLLQKAH